jgi:hypothetical protein
MDQSSTGLMYLKTKLPRISDTKIKEGACAGPQIREPVQDVKSEEQLSEVGKATKKSLKKCLYQFFGGNRKSENYRDVVTDLVQSYKAMERTMSLTLILLTWRIW